MGSKKTIRSEKTFVEEYGLLKDIPGLLYESPGKYSDESGLDIHRKLSELGGQQREQRSGIDTEGRPPVWNPEVDWESIGSSGWSRTGAQVDDLFKKDKNGEGFIDRLLEETGLDIRAIIDRVWDDDGYAKALAANVRKFGTDAYGEYLNWHAFVNSNSTPWGMYFYLENIFAFGKILCNEARKYDLDLEQEDGIKLAFWVVYRHELFHYHVERFAIVQELIQRRPIYRPYKKNVFYEEARNPGPDWLEEALAQAVVLKSRIVSCGLPAGKYPSRRLKNLLMDLFDRFPPGYRDYHCEDHGRAAEAHKKLGAQIITGRKGNLPKVTELATPELEYRSNRKDVPAYLLLNAQTISRFQFQGPKMRKFLKYLRKRGYPRHRDGPGDHEVYMVEGQQVTVNDHGGHIDKNSFDRLLSVLNETLGMNLNAYKLKEMINSI